MNDFLTKNRARILLPRPQKSTTGKTFNFLYENYLKIKDLTGIILYF